MGQADQHFDSDEGSFHWYALGAPLSLDFGSMYSPSIVQPWLHSTLNFDRQRIWTRGEVARFVSDGVTEPDSQIAAPARSAGLTATGYLAKAHAFVVGVPETEPAPESVDADTTRADIRAWRSADAAGTAEAYQGYLDAFPDGQFRGMAESRIEALGDTPDARAEEEEAALALSRTQRQEIQRDLSLLDYNTRGIDGIFGRGTRAAIGDWQAANSFPATGYLTREQITRLDAQAERRAAELELEAERRLQEQLARDRAFWEETGASGDEAGLTAYLERFPDGQFADDARRQLDVMQSEKRARTTDPAPNRAHRAIPQV